MQIKPVNRQTVVNITIFVEGFLLLVATGWAHLSGMQLLKAFHFDYRVMLIGIGAGIVMAASAYVLYAMSRGVGFLAQLRQTVDAFLIPLVSELKPFDIVVIAVLSGFCEEVLFRGVAQPQFGLIITSVAFGLFHDPTFRNVTYSILAFVYGLALGLLFQFTGNLWAPIFAHATHNLISLLLLRYWMKPPAPAAS